jgi:hypothetical protein
MLLTPRAETRGEGYRVALGDTAFARDVVEKIVEVQAFQNNAPEYAIEAADRFRGRVLEWELQERLRQAPPASHPLPAQPPDLTFAEDDREALLTAASYVIEQARTAAAASGLSPPLDAAEIAAMAQHRSAAFIWIQPVGARIAFLLISSDGKSHAVWSPLSLPRWQSAAAGLLESPDHSELQRRLWEALFEPLQGHLLDASHVVVMPPPGGALVPYGLLRDANGRFAVDLLARAIVGGAAHTWQARPLGAPTSEAGIHPRGSR